MLSNFFLCFFYTPGEGGNFIREFQIFIGGVLRGGGLPEGEEGRILYSLYFPRRMVSSFTGGRFLRGKDFVSRGGISLFRGGIFSFFLPGVSTLREILGGEGGRKIPGKGGCHILLFVTRGRFFSLLGGGGF